MATDAFTLWPQLGLQHDGGHAFYMGVELARAELAFQLGKRYVQDQPLDWGAALPRRDQDLDAWCAPGTTRVRPVAPSGALTDAPPATDNADDE